MGIVVITEPAIEPVTLDKAKMQLDIESDETSEDSLITGYIKAARQYCERFLNRKLITTTIEFVDGCFPSNIIALSLPVAQVTSITYVDDAGDTQLLDSSAYVVDVSGDTPAIQVVDSWPSTKAILGAVKIRATAGYGPAITDVPEPIINAMLLMIRDWYDNPADRIHKMPTRSESLLQPYIRY